MSANVTLTATPSQYAICNSEIWFQGNSGSSSQPNFLYLYNVNMTDEFTSGDSLSLIASYLQIPPNPADGTGLFSVSRILRSEVGFNCTPSITTSEFDFNTPVNYNINYGFQYNPLLEAYDVVYDGPQLGLSFSYDITSVLSVGDIITYNKNNPTINQLYNGTWSIVSIIPPSFAGTNMVLGQSTPNGTDGGQITNIIRWNGTSSNFTAFNGVVQYGYPNNFDQYVMTPGATYSPWLTDYTGYRLINYTDYETAGFIMTQTSSTVQLEVITYDQYMEELNTYDISQTNLFNFGVPNTSFWSIGTGPTNLSEQGVSFTNVGYYTLQLRIAGGHTLSQLLYRQINLNCSIYTPVRLCFQNVYGVAEYWTFTQDLKQTRTFKPAIYKQTLPWNYVIGDRGYNVLSSQVYDSFVLNSNWISESDYAYLVNNLSSSPQVYIVDTSGNPWPILLTDSSSEYKTSFRDTIFNYVITYRNAYDINIQNA